MFFEVNNVLEEKKEPTILTLVGNKMYALLGSIVSLRRPKDLSFAEVVDNLVKHLDPKPIVIAERFKFHKAEQQESESIRESLLDLISWLRLASLAVVAKRRFGISSCAV